MHPCLACRLQASVSDDNSFLPSFVFREHIVGDLAVLFEGEEATGGGPT